MPDSPSGWEDIAFERSLLRSDIKAGNADAATEQLRRVRTLEGEGVSNVQRFRKKPVVIEALRWDGYWKDVLSFVVAQGGDACVRKDGKLEIGTLEGVMIADEGDWIIRGVKGEFYPCKPDIFEATYEAVNDDA